MWGCMHVYVYEEIDTIVRRQSSVLVEELLHSPAVTSIMNFTKCTEQLTEDRRVLGCWAMYAY